MKESIKGFTLIETVLVITLISILTIITTPLVSNIISRIDLNLAHESLYNSLLRAQQLSKIQYRNQQWRLCIDNTINNKKYVISAGTTCSQSLYPETIQINSNIEITSNQTLDLQFKPITGELNYSGDSIKITLSSGGINKSILVSKMGVIDKNPVN